MPIRTMCLKHLVRLCQKQGEKREPTVFGKAVFYEETLLVLNTVSKFTQSQSRGV